MAFLTPSELRMLGENSGFSTIFITKPQEISFTDQVISTDRKAMNITALRDTHFDWRLRLAASKKEYSSTSGHFGPNYTSEDGGNPEDRLLIAKKFRKSQQYHSSHIFLAWRAESCRLRVMERKKMSREKRTMLKSIKWARKRVILSDKIRTWKAHVDLSIVIRTVITGANIKRNAKSLATLLRAWMYHASQRLLRRRLSSKISNSLISQNFQRCGRTFFELCLERKHRRRKRLSLQNQNYSYLSRKVLAIWIEYIKREACICRLIQTTRKINQKGYLQMFRFITARTRRLNNLQLRFSLRYRRGILKIAVEGWADGKANSSSTRSANARALVRQIFYLTRRHFLSMEAHARWSLRVKNIILSVNRTICESMLHRSVSVWWYQVLETRKHAGIYKIISLRRNRAVLTSIARLLFQSLSVLRRQAKQIHRRKSFFQLRYYRFWIANLERRRHLVRRSCFFTQHFRLRSSLRCFDALHAGLDAARAAEGYVCTCLRIRAAKIRVSALACWRLVAYHAHVTRLSALTRAAAKCSLKRSQFLRLWRSFVGRVVSIRAARDKTSAGRQQILKAGVIRLLRRNSALRRRRVRLGSRASDRSAERLSLSVLCRWRLAARRTMHDAAVCKSLLDARSLARRKEALRCLRGYARRAAVLRRRQAMAWSRVTLAILKGIFAAWACDWARRRAAGRVLGLALSRRRRGLLRDCVCGWQRLLHSLQYLSKRSRAAAAHFAMGRLRLVLVQLWLRSRAQRRKTWTARQLQACRLRELARCAAAWWRWVKENQERVMRLCGMYRSVAALCDRVEGHSHTIGALRCWIRQTQVARRLATAASKVERDRRLIGIQRVLTRLGEYGHARRRRRRLASHVSSGWRRAALFTATARWISHLKLCRVHLRNVTKLVLRRKALLMGVSLYRLARNAKVCRHAARLRSSCITRRLVAWSRNAVTAWAQVSQEQRRLRRAEDRLVEGIDRAAIAVALRAWAVRYRAELDLGTKMERFEEQQRRRETHRCVGGWCGWVQQRQALLRVGKSLELQRGIQGLGEAWGSWIDLFSRQRMHKAACVLLRRLHSGMLCRTFGLGWIMSTYEKRLRSRLLCKGQVRLVRRLTSRHYDLWRAAVADQSREKLLNGKAILFSRQQRATSVFLKLDQYVAARRRRRVLEDKAGRLSKAALKASMLSCCRALIDTVCSARAERRMLEVAARMLTKWDLQNTKKTWWIWTKETEQVQDEAAQRMRAKLHRQRKVRGNSFTALRLYAAEKQGWISRLDCGLQRLARMCLIMALTRWADNVKSDRMCVRGTQRSDELRYRSLSGRCLFGWWQLWSSKVARSMLAARISTRRRRTTCLQSLLRWREVKEAMQHCSWKLRKAARLAMRSSFRYVLARWAFVSRRAALHTRISGLVVRRQLRVNSMAFRNLLHIWHSIARIRCRAENCLRGWQHRIQNKRLRVSILLWRDWEGQERGLSTARRLIETRVAQKGTKTCLRRWRLAAIAGMGLTKMQDLEIQLRSGEILHAGLANWRFKSTGQRMQRAIIRWFTCRRRTAIIWCRFKSLQYFARQSRVLRRRSQAIAYFHCRARLGDSVLAWWFASRRSAFLKRGLSRFRAAAIARTLSWSWRDWFACASTCIARSKSLRRCISATSRRQLLVAMGKWSVQSVQMRKELKHLGFLLRRHVRIRTKEYFSAWACGFFHRRGLSRRSVKVASLKVVRRAKFAFSNLSGYTAVRRRYFSLSARPTAYSFASARQSMQIWRQAVENRILADKQIQSAEASASRFRMRSGRRHLHAWAAQATAHQQQQELIRQVVKERALNTKRRYITALCNCAAGKVCLKRQNELAQKRLQKKTKHRVTRFWANWASAARVASHAAAVVQLRSIRGRLHAAILRWVIRTEIVARNTNSQNLVYKTALRRQGARLIACLRLCVHQSLASDKLASALAFARHRRWLLAALLRWHHARVAAWQRHLLELKIQDRGRVRRILSCVDFWKSRVDSYWYLQTHEHLLSRRQRRELLLRCWSAASQHVQAKKKATQSEAAAQGRACTLVAIGCIAALRANVVELRRIYAAASKLQRIHDMQAMADIIHWMRGRAVLLALRRRRGLCLERRHYYRLLVSSFTSFLHRLLQKRRKEQVMRRFSIARAMDKTRLLFSEWRKIVQKGRTRSKRLVVRRRGKMLAHSRNVWQSLRLFVRTQVFNRATVQSRRASREWREFRRVICLWAGAVRMRHYLRRVNSGLLRRRAFYTLQQGWMLLLSSHGCRVKNRHAVEVASRRAEIRIAKLGLLCFAEYATVRRRHSALQRRVGQRQGWGARVLMQLWWNAAQHQVQSSRMTRDALQESIWRAEKVARREGKQHLSAWAATTQEIKRVRVGMKNITADRLRQAVARSIHSLRLYAQQKVQQHWWFRRAQRQLKWLSVRLSWRIWEGLFHDIRYLRAKAKKAIAIFRITAAGNALNEWASWTKRWNRALKMLSCSSVVASYRKRVSCLQAWHTIASLQRTRKVRRDGDTWRSKLGCARRVLLAWSAVSNSARSSSRSRQRLQRMQRKAEKGRRFFWWREHTRAVAEKKILMQKRLRETGWKRKKRCLDVLDDVVSLIRAARAAADQLANRVFLRYARSAWESWLHVMARTAVLKHAAAALISQRKKIAILGAYVATWLHAFHRWKSSLSTVSTNLAGKMLRTKSLIFKAWHSMLVGSKKLRPFFDRADARLRLYLQSHSIKFWFHLVLTKCFWRRTSAIFWSRQKQRLLHKSCMLLSEAARKCRFKRSMSHRAEYQAKQSTLSKVLRNWRLKSFMNICTFAKIQLKLGEQRRRLQVAWLDSLRRHSRLSRRVSAAKLRVSNRLLERSFFFLHVCGQNQRAMRALTRQQLNWHRKSRDKALFLTWVQASVRHSAAKMIIIVAKRLAEALSGRLTLRKKRQSIACWAAAAADLKRLHIAASRVLHRRIRWTARTSVKSLQNFAYRQRSSRRAAQSVTNIVNKNRGGQIFQAWMWTSRERHRLCSLEVKVARRKQEKWLNGRFYLWRGYIASRDCILVVKAAVIKFCRLRVGYLRRAAIPLVSWRATCLQKRRVTEKAAINIHRWQQGILRKWMYIARRKRLIFKAERKLCWILMQRTYTIILELWFYYSVHVPTAIRMRTKISASRLITAAWRAWVENLRVAVAAYAKAVRLHSVQVLLILDTTFSSWLDILKWRESVLAAFTRRTKREMAGGRGPLTHSILHWQCICTAGRRKRGFLKRAEMKSCSRLQRRTLTVFYIQAAAHKHRKGLVRKAEGLVMKRCVPVWHRIAMEQAHVAQDERRATIACSRFALRRLLLTLRNWIMVADAERQIQRKEITRAARLQPCFIRSCFLYFSSAIAGKKIRRHRAEKAAARNTCCFMHASFVKMSRWAAKIRRRQHLVSVLGGQLRLRQLNSAMRRWVMAGSESAASRLLAESWRVRLAQQLIFVGSFMALWQKRASTSKRKLTMGVLHHRAIVSFATLKWAKAARTSRQLHRTSAVIENRFVHHRVEMFLAFWTHYTMVRQQMQVRMAHRRRLRLLSSALRALRNKAGMLRRLRGVEAAVEGRFRLRILLAWTKRWILTAKQGRKATSALMQSMMRRLLKLLVDSFGQWTSYIQHTRKSARIGRVALRMLRRREMLLASYVLRYLRQTATQARLDSSGAWRELVGDEWRASLRRERCLRCWRIAAKKCKRVRICYARAEAACRRRLTLNGLLVWASWASFRLHAKRKARRLTSSKTAGQLRAVLAAMGAYTSWRRRLTRRMALASTRCATREREACRVIFAAWIGVLNSSTRGSGPCFEGSDLRAVMEAVADRLGRLREDLSCIPCDSDGTGTSEPDRLDSATADERDLDI